MRRLLVWLVIMVFLPLASAQTSSPSLLSTPLTSEQIAVYTAFLKGYAGNDKVALNVAQETGPLRDFGGKPDPCLKDFPAQQTVGSHSFTNEMFSGLPVKVVNPRLHELHDPGNAIHNPGDVDRAVNDGFAHALMTLSEIVFDARHQSAAFSYAFVCGGLCGNGGIVIYNRHGETWVPSKKQCSRWIS